jgi:arginine utilization protein RocB
MSESFSEKAKRAASRALDEAERRYAASGDRAEAGHGSTSGSTGGSAGSSTDRLVQKAKEAASEVLDRVQDRGERFAEKAGRATSDVVDRTVGSLDADDEGSGVAAFVRRNARRRPVVTVVAAVLVGVAVGKTISR